MPRYSPQKDDSTCQQDSPFSTLISPSIILSLPTAFANPKGSSSRLCMLSKDGLLMAAGSASLSSSRASLLLHTSSTKIPSWVSRIFCSSTIPLNTPFPLSYI